MESLSMDWSKQSHIDIESQLEVTQEAREREDMNLTFQDWE